MIGLAALGVAFGAVAASSPRAETSRAAQDPSVEVIATTRDLVEHMTRLPDIASSTSEPHGLVIKIVENVQHQTITGFGASMTDSSAWLLSKLPRTQRGRVMDRLFGRAGIDLSFVRVPIGASDFTANGSPYSYDDLPRGQSDPLLRHFSIGHDRAYVLPALRQARRIDPGLELLANTWSPPAWMKTNGSLNDRNDQGYIGALKPSAYGPFAHYIVRFIQAYARAGVPIQAITPQNEPGGSGKPLLLPTYPGMALSVGGQERFISHDLRPALTAAGLSPVIFGLDLSWDSLAGAKSLVRQGGRGPDGIAWHCYFGNPQRMSRLNELAPEIPQIVDECSTEIRAFSESEFLIASLRNRATVVADWYLALDPDGGPVQAPNPGCYGCRGVVTVDPRTGTVSYGLKYYELGQVSALVKPGAIRIGSNNFVSYAGRDFHVSPGLDDVAFLNPDGTKVLVVYNSASRKLRFAVQMSDRRSFSSTITPSATESFVWR